MSTRNFTKVRCDGPGCNYSCDYSQVAADADWKLINNGWHIFNDKIETKHFCSKDCKNKFFKKTGVTVILV